MSKPLPYFLAVRALMCACIAVALSGCGSTSADSKQKGGGGKGGRGGGQMTIPVAVAKAEVRDLPILLNGLGSVDAFNTVAVKSRLDGQLIKVNVREGQEVKQGELLAEIDPRPYEVQLSQAQATLFKDQAALKDARLNLERFQPVSYTHLTLPTICSV